MHPRLRRTRRDILARLIAWPLIAAGITITAIGFTQPEALTGVAPVQRVVIDR